MSEFQKAMLSKHIETIAKKLAKQEDVDVGCNKLIPHLMEHKNYCIHYRNLKFVKELGVKIGKVHNIVSFKQKEWLKEYIVTSILLKELRLRMTLKKTFSS